MLLGNINPPILITEHCGLSIVVPFSWSGYGQRGGGGKGFLNLKGDREEHIHRLKQSLSCEKIKRRQTK